MNALVGKHVQGNAKMRLTLDNVSMATRLLDKKREMMEVQSTLDAQKKEFSVREENLAAREDVLNKKNAELRASLYKFNKFLHENDIKRQRAEKKEQEEIRARLQKEAEIEKLKEELEDLQHQREEISSVLERSSRYQKYLEAVVELNEDSKHSDAELLLGRYSTLEAAHQDLLDRTNSAMQETEELKTKMQRFTEEKTNDNLKFNNELGSLQKHLEDSENSALLVQAESDLKRSADLNEHHKLAQLQLACRNVFARCIESSQLKNSRARYASIHAPSDQLRVIRQYLEDLVGIVQTWSDNGPPQRTGYRN